MPANYTEGQIVECLATFLNDQKAAVDPTTVALKYYISATPTIIGTPTPTTINFVGLAIPAPGAIARLGVGSYEAQLDTTSKPGFWFYEWVTTGQGQVTSPPGSFYVQAKVF